MADQNLVDQLKRHEGAKRDADGMHVAYRCPAGALTIGYGHNLDANPVPGINAESRLTEDQAERLLIADIDRASKELARVVPWSGSVDSVRRAVLVNLLFNMGAKGLLGFTNTLSDIKRGDYRAASRRMLQSLWAAQVGKRAQELSRQMATGVWA